MTIDENGHTTYETLDEIISDGIDMLTECGDCYYVTSLKDPHTVYVKAHKDERICGSPTVWMVDKKTEKVAYFGEQFFYLLEFKDKATPININEFLKERKRRSA